MSTAERMATASPMETDHELRERIRAELPPAAFERCPHRAWLFLLLFAAAIGLSVAIATQPIPWWLALVGALVVGNVYGSLLFLGHEIAHGAVVTSRRWQDVYMTMAGLIYCLPARLWREWHNGVHHPYANIDGHDPDNFGTLERYRTSASSRFFVLFAPGSGHIFSSIYLFSFFTIHGQGVLWLKSKDHPGYKRLNRTKAKMESALIALAWVAVCVSTGWRGTLFAVLIPMWVANFAILSYIVTNHMLRGLTPVPATLDVTMSLTTWRILDLIHFNFSHHVEHHLFPGMSSRWYPVVRKSLEKRAGARYMAPPHIWALKMLYRTPRIYDGPRTLVEPKSGRRVEITSIERQLGNL